MEQEKYLGTVRFWTYYLIKVVWPKDMCSNLILCFFFYGSKKYYIELYASFSIHMFSHGMKKRKECVHYVAQSFIIQFQSTDSEITV